MGLFYGGLSLLLLLIVLDILPMLMPQGLASRISYNSEAYLFAVVLALWIQMALPRVRVDRRMMWALAVGGVWFVVGLGLLASDLPSRIRTLNESAFALGLIPYVSLRRPIPRWLFLSVPLMVCLTVWAVVWARDSWIIDQAETVGFFVLAVLTFDVVDRELLNPVRRTSARTRIAWYGFLMLEPVLVSGLGTDIRAGGGAVALTLEYLGRIHESFFGVVLVVAILLLGRRGDSEKSGSRLGPRVGASSVLER